MADAINDGSVSINRITISVMAVLSEVTESGASTTHVSDVSAPYLVDCDPAIVVISAV